MKKFFAFATTATMLFGFASCSSELDAPGAEGDGNVNFTVTLPGTPGTRAFSDGLTAENLQVAVYDVTDPDNVLLATTKEQDFGNSLQTTVNLNLANGRSYRIAFFASLKDGSPYTFDTANRKITVDYSKMTEYNSTDSYDCFYQLFETGKVTAAINETVTLYRPVAQINWGTSDLKEDVLKVIYGANDLENLYTKVTTMGYTEFDMFAKDVVEGTQEDVTYGLAARPAATEDFPYQPKGDDGEAVKTYDYLSMQYLLVPQASSLVDLKLESAASATATDAIAVVNVPNAPVQANFRTNIFGALLTNPAEFNVVKEQNYETPDYNVAWNGEVDKNIPSEDVAGVTTYTITTPAQLAGLSALVKEGDTFKGKAVRLDADLDMNNEMFTPIGYFSSNGAYGFAGTFDGNGKTISNLNCVEVPNGDSNAAGLFAYIKSGAEIKNLTVDGAKVMGTHFAGVICGYAHAGDAANLKITNCIVKNSSVVSSMGKNGNDGDKAGAITGFLQKGEVTGCMVDNVTVEAMRDCGVFVGCISQAPSQATKVQNNRASNSTLTVKGNAAEALGTEVGRIVKNGSINVSGNTFTGCTMNVADFDCREASGDKQFINITCKPGVTLNIVNVKSRGMYVTQPNTEKVTVKNCTFTKAAVLGDKSSKSYLCRKGIEIISTRSDATANAEITGCDFQSSFGHSIQFQNYADVNVTVKGNKFAGWGQKEEDQADIETSCAIVVCGTSLCDTPEARQAFVDQFLKDNTCASNYTKNDFKYGYVRFDTTPAYVANEQGEITQK